MESDSETLTLTTHRLRFYSKEWGRARLTSIMLDQLCSCELHYKSYVVLLAVAMLAGLAMFAGLVGGQDSQPLACLVVALLFVGAYYFTRRQALVFASGAAKIEVATKGMGLDTAIAFIDAVEAAQAEAARRIGKASPVSHKPTPST